MAQTLKIIGTIQKLAILAPKCLDLYTCVCFLSTCTMYICPYVLLRTIFILYNLCIVHLVILEHEERRIYIEDSFSDKIVSGKPSRANSWPFRRFGLKDYLARVVPI